MRTHAHTHTHTRYILELELFGCTTFFFFFLPPFSLLHPVVSDEPTYSHPTRGCALSGSNFPCRILFFFCCYAAYINLAPHNPSTPFQPVYSFPIIHNTIDRKSPLIIRFGSLTGGRREHRIRSSPLELLSEGHWCWVIAQKRRKARLDWVCCEWRRVYVSPLVPWGLIETNREREQHFY